MCEHTELVRGCDGCVHRMIVGQETVTKGLAARAIVDWLRHQASGYALLRSVKANGARDALYSAAAKLEKDWQEIVLPRTTHPITNDKKESNG